MPALIGGDCRRYAEGGKVEVHYDPNNPTAAVLECRVRGLWVLWGVASAMLIGAAVLVGLIEPGAPQAQTQKSTRPRCWVVSLTGTPTTGCDLGRTSDQGSRVESWPCEPQHRAVRNDTKDTRVRLFDLRSWHAECTRRAVTLAP